MGLLLSFEMLSTTAASFTDIDGIIFYTYTIYLFSRLSIENRKNLEKSTKTRRTDGWEKGMAGAAHRTRKDLCILHKK